jgi:spore germination protein GerM
VALLLAVSACSISEDGAPRDVPVEERGNFGGVAAGGVATGASRIYLITSTESDQRLLRSVPRDVPGQADDVLRSLLAGRNASEQLETAIPEGLELLSVRPRGGIVTVDINDALAGLDVNGVRFAVAQIVATATAIDNVEVVNLRVNGVEQDFPDGNGVLTTGPLSIYDYRGLIESTQPPFPAIPSSS